MKRREGSEKVTPYRLVKSTKKRFSSESCLFLSFRGKRPARGERETKDDTALRMDSFICEPRHLFVYIVKSFRFVKPIFISAIFIDLDGALAILHPVPVPSSGPRFEDKNPKSSIQHRDDRRILAAVHRPAHAFLSRPFPPLPPPFSSSLPGRIYCASYCVHARARPAVSTLV